MSNDLVPYIPVIIAVIALVISIINVLYTWKQNKRQITIFFNFNDKKFRYSDEMFAIDLELYAVNSGFHTVTIKNYEFIVNDKIIEFNHLRRIIDSNGKENYEYIGPNSLRVPHVLKEGELYMATISAVDMAVALKQKKLKGKVKLSGYFETAENKFFWSNQNKIFKSKSLKFDIDEWYVKL